MWGNACCICQQQQGIRVQSSRRCSRVAVIGDLRDAVAGVVQDILSEDKQTLCKLTGTIAGPASKTQVGKLLALACLTFSVISWEWCRECSLSRNILCCSELARRHVSHVDKVQDEMPGPTKGNPAEEKQFEERSF